MLNNTLRSRFFVIHTLIFVFFVDSYYSATGNVKNGTLERSRNSAFSLGVVLDMNSPMGSMVDLCMKMAVSEFYAEHPNYATRLHLHTKNAESVLDANFAVLDLLEHEQVHGILGPQGSTENIFVSELGRKVHVPIISFTARSRSLALPNTENNFFVRTTLDDSVQARALAAICKEFEWTEVVVLYEDTEYGHQFLSHLSCAFQDVEIGLVHLTAISLSAKDSYLFQELSILKKKETKVFLVHMNPSLGFRLFNLAKRVGMMSEGYAWIISDSLSNFLNSMDSVTRDSVRGVVGVRPYVPLSEGLENFEERWKRNSIIQKKNASAIMDLNIYGYWAYDTVTALAIAAEKIGAVNSSSWYVKTANHGARNTNLRISSFGPRLLRELSSTKFRGLSGDFQLVGEKLKPSAFEIINIIGTSENSVGFWTPDRGIMRELSLSGEASYSTSAKELNTVVWPGGSFIRPKGWAIPPTGSLRVGVPWKPGYTEFVKVEICFARNSTNATGFAIDIFLAALKMLPFPINYELFCYNDTKNPNWTYDDMLHGIPQNYDMVVGDITIWAPRASYVDFSLPYSESGVVLVVKNKKALDMWIFTRPLRWDLWLAIAAACIIMGIVIWRLESQEPNPVSGEESVRRSRSERLENTYLAPVAALAFQDRTIVSNNWSIFVLGCWLFMAFIIMQSFTANLSAILTLDQLKFAFSDDYYLGYQKGSFMEKFLTEKLHINKSRLRAYSSVEGFHDAMSRGSKNGGIDAIFNELPYMKLLLNRYESQYKIVGPTYRTDGLGFAFPMGSPLTAYFSRAILTVTQSPEMMSIEQKNFGPGYSSQDPLSSTLSQGTSSLTSRQFGGLFIIVGLLTLFALVCSETNILTRLRKKAAQFISNRRGDTVNPNEDVKAPAPVADPLDNANAGGRDINDDNGESATTGITGNNGVGTDQDGGGGGINDHLPRNL